MDYTNSQDFANSVQDATLDTLRLQEDAQQQQILADSFSFNPSVFNITTETNQQFAPGDTRFIVLGPYKFDRRFAKEPSLVFGNVQQYIQAPLQVGITIGTPSSYTPFVVKADIFQWTMANGEVDGFYVALYALTRPPVGSLTHTINWQAVGKASRYTDTSQTEQSWTQSYDYNSAGFLNDSTDVAIGTDEDFGGDSGIGDDE